MHLKGLIELLQNERTSHPQSSQLLSKDMKLGTRSEKREEGKKAGDKQGTSRPKRGTGQTGKGGTGHHTQEGNRAGRWLAGFLPELELFLISFSTFFQLDF